MAMRRCRDDAPLFAHRPSRQCPESIPSTRADLNYDLFAEAAE